MILLHERMNEDAEHVKTVIEDLFEIPVSLVEDNLDQLFTPIPQFQGYYYVPKTDLLSQRVGATITVILTPRDIYGGDKSKDDEWAFAANVGQFSVLATARLMGPDNTPRSSLCVERNLYLRRLSLMTVHELGHDLIKAPHYKNAAWVNVQNGISMPLGPHCDDNSCAMYEVVDVITPPRDEGHLLLGDERLYDAGMDEHLARLRADWFCSRCRDHIVISDAYRGIYPST
jgi:predicted Zn-dependent protease